MTKKKMTLEEEHAFYARPENQEPQGPLADGKSKLTEMVPVRFPPETLEEVRRRGSRRPLRVELNPPGGRARARTPAQTG